MFWKIPIQKCECPPCAEHLCRVQGSVPWNTPSFRERTSLWGRWTGCREGRHCGPAAEESPCDSGVPPLSDSGLWFPTAGTVPCPGSGSQDAWECLVFGHAREDLGVVQSELPPLRWGADA